MREAASKIVSRDVLRQELMEHKRKGRRIVLANGCFDTLHVVLIAEPNVEALLEELRRDVHAKGTDYTAESVPERGVAARLGIHVAIVGDPKDHSTRELLESIRKAPHG